MVDLADKIGVKRETLRDQKQRGRLSPEVQSALAKNLAFRLDWPQWQTGPAEQFKKEYRRVHSHLPASAPERRTDVRLARGPRREPMPSETVGLAAVEIDGSQFGPGTAAIEITVSCGMPMVLGVHTTIQSGRIQLKCSPALLTKDSLKGWTGAERKITGSRGVVRVSFEAGTRVAPSWRLTGDGVSIGTIVLDPDFAALEELAPGDEVTLLFGTWLSDIQEAEGAANDAAAPPADVIALVRSDGSELAIPAAELSKRKQQVIACIRKGLLPADNNGYVVLASHVLQMVEAKS